MGMKGVGVRAFQGLVDAVLRVDRRSALNTGLPVAGGGRGIAAELKVAILALQDEAFDLERGLVDYQRLRSSDSFARYRECTAHLARFDPAELVSRNEKLAFWINLYNALIIDGVIACGLKRSVREDLRLFRRAAYVVGDQRYSADDIEHGILRGNRGHPLLKVPQFWSGDPRLVHTIEPVEARAHFALVCASRSCPPIAVYDAATVDRQLDLAAASFINNGAVELDRRRGRLRLSPIFRWYARDFGGREGVLELLRRHLQDESLCRHLRSQRKSVPLSYQRYDWSLNKV